MKPEEMGAGRKTKTLHFKEKGETKSTVNCSAPARNLRKSDLGAVIFVCNYITLKECHSEELFGLPAPHFAYVKNIRSGLALFLFNCSDRKLHGIYEATSQGQMNINPYGWTKGHAYNTPYPAQVKMKVRMQCSPLAEEEFKPLIVENYTEPKFFWFELDHAQTQRLVSKFTSRPSVPRPLNKAKNKTGQVGQRSENSGMQVSRNAFVLLDDTDVESGGSREAFDSVGTETFDLHPKPTSGHSYSSIASGMNTSLPEQESNPSTEKKWPSLFKSSTTTATKKKDEFVPKVSDINLHDSGEEWTFSSDVPSQNGEKGSFEVQNSTWGSENNDAENQSFEAQNSEWVNGSYGGENQSFEIQNPEWASGSYGGENQYFETQNPEWASGSYGGENQYFETQNPEWASGSYGGENQYFETQNPEWASGSYDGENQTFQAPNSEWAIGNYDAQNRCVEAPTLEWGTGNYEAGWQVPAFDISSEAPIVANEGKDTNLVWLGDDVECGHPPDVILTVHQPSREVPVGSDKGKIGALPCSNGSHTDDDGASASDTTTDPDEDDQPEPIAENVDPSAVVVADIPSPHVQALLVKLMEEVEELKASHQTISGLQQELAESKSEIQLLQTRCQILESRLLPSAEDIKETIDPSATLIADLASPDGLALLFKLIKEVEELKVSNQMISVLKQELVESKAEIRLLKTRCNILESRLLPSAEDVNVAMTECWVEPCPVIKDPILIVGGFDGSMWLPDLCSYLPFEDVIRPLNPMSEIRKYSSAVTMNGELYVLGGENGDMWHDTVESYNPVTDQWSSHAPLNQKKGSLAGASLLGKIYAIGGGNGEDCFSGVEMLDLNIGTWIPTRSMLHKRFAPAAAELNGAIYVVGGYDGNSYLSSTEIFDPREPSWTSLRSMGTRRSCHSLTVLNDKLYALGGYNGAEMVSTTEIFDPRMGSWMAGASMNSPRGYFGAVVLGQKMHVIGGITQNDEIRDTIEVYEEGHSWEMTDLKGVGKRCFFSAVNL